MMSRIVSLLPSATEIVCVLGLESNLVGRSHECDYPPSVTRLPICTSPQFDVEGSSRSIDRQVKALLEQALSIYRVDRDTLRTLAPTHIVTQTQCDVCAVNPKDVESALAELAGPDPSLAPQLIALAPNTLAGVWEDIRTVAGWLGVPERGAEVVTRLLTRVRAIECATQASSPPLPTVACLEWLDPLMTAGNWVPEMVRLAGGRNLFGTAGAHSPWTTWEDLRASDPDLIVIFPCGFDIGRTRKEMGSLTARPGWGELRAVAARRVFLADGSHYFNRPGPRLVESLEILAEIIRPDAFRFGHEGRSWVRL